MDLGHPKWFIDEFQRRRRQLTRLVGPGLCVAIVMFAVAYYFVEPAPPSTLEIATGNRGGRYYTFGQEYVEAFARNGINLKVRETAGSGENFELLRNNSVSLAMIQGGIAPEAVVDTGLETIATLYFEPLWVFHRSDLPVQQLHDLQGMQTAIGKEGSGTRSLALQLLEDNGVVAGEDNTVFADLSATEASQALRAGKIDAAMLVMGPDASVIRILLSDPEVRVMNFSRNHAYARRYPYLKAVTLEAGVIDFEQNLPEQPVRLVAPAASLVASDSLHQAFIPLLLEAAIERHRNGGLLAVPGELPSADFVTFPINQDARRYLDHGPSFFQQHVSFWVASLIDRTKIMIIPIVTLCIPLVKLAPPVYRWRIRSRIYRWYGILRKIDQDLREESNTDLSKHQETLKAMSTELDSVHVPLSYMQEFYHLRVHINLVREEVERHVAPVRTDNAPEKSGPGEPS